MGQKQQLIWDLPPIESFYLNASIYDIDKLETKRRIKKLSDMLEIDEELYLQVRSEKKNKKIIRNARNW